MAATFLFGMQKAFSIGWRDAARPLLVDYVDRLAAEIGSPPSIERAQALVQRLPVAVRISGPQVNWRSHPANPEQERRWNDANRWKGRRAPPAGAHHRRRPPHPLFAERAALARPAARDRLGHAGRAAVAHRAGLPARAPPAAPAGRHPRRRDALRRGRFRPAHPRAPSGPPGRAGRTRRHHQHHGRRHPPDARRQARAAAGHQPRTAQPADPRPPQHRTAARNPRRGARAATPCCATWA